MIDSSGCLGSHASPAVRITDIDTAAFQMTCPLIYDDLTPHADTFVTAHRSL
jgi:hypothetical protein